MGPYPQQAGGAYQGQGYGSYYGSRGYGMVQQRMDYGQSQMDYGQPQMDYGQTPVAPAATGRGISISPKVIGILLVLVVAAYFGYNVMTDEGPYGREGMKEYMAKNPGTKVMVTLVHSEEMTFDQVVDAINATGGQPFAGDKTTRKIQFFIAAVDTKGLVEEPWVESFRFAPAPVEKKEP